MATTLYDDLRVQKDRITARITALKNEIKEKTIKLNMKKLGIK